MATTTTKHTPGPWGISSDNICIVGPTNEMRQYVDGEGATREQPSELIALAYSCGGLNLGANARLIAAAPEMLEMLRQVNEDIGWLSDANSPNSRLGKSLCIPIERVRALIARIEGETP